MIERFRAALACQAVADAIGDPFEFQQFVPANAVRHELARTPGLNAEIGITDDTQMTYFGMRALVAILDTGSLNGAKGLLTVEYLNWYQTQLGRCPKGVPKALVARRSPGTACLNSMKQISLKGERLPNQKHGCGSVMRLLPFAFLPGTAAKRLKLALMSGQVTHGGAESDEAVRLYMDFAEGCRNRSGVDVLDCIPARIREATKIQQLGAGFYAEECVDMALWAVYHSTTYEECIVNAIAHGGDSDSVGAVAGAMWGMLMGCTPDKRLLDRLIEWKELDKLAKKFVSSVKAFNPA